MTVEASNDGQKSVLSYSNTSKNINFLFSVCLVISLLIYNTIIECFMHKNGIKSIQFHYKVLNVQFKIIIYL